MSDEDWKPGERENFLLKLNKMHKEALERAETYSRMSREAANFANGIAQAISVLEAP